MIEHVNELSKRAFDLSPPIVMNYKGKTTDAGFFYCPYIPLQMIKIEDEDDRALSGPVRTL